jgi:dTDP-4-amino-4,6-dideoxygalactose transaminase
MIPRFAPNFRLRDLLRATFTGAAPGPACFELAARVAAATGCRDAVLAPSGRGALRLLLLALPPPFDAGRVVVPAYTCSAVVEAARLAGREVVAVDHLSGSLNLCPADLAGVLRAGDVVVATHQYGYAADVDGLRAVAESAGATIIEDLAAGLSGTVGGQPMGSLSRAGFGSFDTSKLVHAPSKGGFVVTNDTALASRLGEVAAELLQLPSLARKVAALVGAGLLVVSTRRGLYPLFYALNFTLRGRLTAEDGALAARPNAFYTNTFAEWQATVALPQLRALPALLARRAAIHRAYREGILPGPAFDLEPQEAEVPGASIRFPLYARGDKAELHRRLAAAGVDTGFSFTTIAAPAAAKGAWRIAGRVLNLPLYAALTDAEVARVVAVARAAHQDVSGLAPPSIAQACA